MRKAQTRLKCILFLLLPAFILGIAEATYADGGRHFLIPESPSGVTIDPTNCDDSDWPTDVLPFDIVSLSGIVLGNGKMVISHLADLTTPDGEELYIYVEMTEDPNTNDNDQVVLMFDNSHDHNPPDTTSYRTSDDRGIRFRRDGTVVRVYGELANPQEALDEAYFEASRRCIEPDDGGTWRFEAKILPSDLGLNGFGSLVGAAVLSQDADNLGDLDAIGRWPDTDVTGSPDQWVNLVSRAPIDYILLIDRSGSMSGDKWNSVRRAGDNFALILAELKDDDLDSEYANLSPPQVPIDGDRLGLATFTSAHGADGGDTVIALSPIPGDPGDYVSGVLPASPGGLTPMIGGINEAIDMLGGGNSILAHPLDRNRMIMLLSDGMHNTPSTALDPATDFLRLTCGSSSPVQIHTVAVGTDTTVDTDKLDSIKDCFAGNIGPDGDSSATTIYNTTGIGGQTEEQLTAQLTKFFVETLLPDYRWNLLNDDGDDFDIKAGERKLLLFAFWPATGDPTISLSITKPDGSTEDGTCDEDLGYCHLLLENEDLEQGEYTNFDAPGAVPNGKFVLLDLRTEARFGVDNRPHGTSSDVTLRAKLREDGRPILGADVRVDISRPEEGFGTFVVTHDLKCETRTPQLPSIDNILRPIYREASPHIPITGAEPSSRAAKLAAAQDVSPDVPGDRFLLMEQLLEVCQKDDLQRTEDTGLQLFDDGTHGDAVADDGVYTLRFSNTEIEGSYGFRFRADGTISDGQPFSRIKEVAEYIRLDVDPTQSAAGSRVLQQSGNLIWREYYVLPQSAAGEYLGPGFAHQADFLALGGFWVTPVRDYGNGYYARLLQYDKTQGEPDVTTVVQGEAIRRGAATCLPWWVCLLLILLLLLIILLLLLYVRRLRRWLKQCRSEQGASH